MSIRQISVFLENKPGRLYGMTSLLAEQNIDIRALTLSESTDFGIARFIVDDVEQATAVLREGGFLANDSKVLAFLVPNEPGGLNRLLTEFEAAGVNIEYMYAFQGSSNPKNAYMIFRVNHTAESEEKLVGRGLVPLTQEDMQRI